MTTKRIEEFYQFLKDNNCYVKFFAYFMLFNKRENDVSLYLEKTNEYNPILNAFNWVKTDEGRTYWEKIDSKWRETIQEKCVTIKIKGCSKGNTEISLDVVTALERMDYIVTLVKVE